MKIHCLLAALITTICLSLSTTSLLAADVVPKLINFQGKLTDALGAALGNGTYTLKFELFSKKDSSQTGDALVWGESRAVTVVNGVFNVALGGAGSTAVGSAAVSDLTLAFGDSERFLQTTIVSGPGVTQPQTLMPRQQMASVPFAVQAQGASQAANADRLGGETPSFWLPPGGIVAYGGSIDPPGWLLCNGRAVSRTQYSNLFGVIGTVYGVGNGTTTFNLPNGQGLVLRGSGSQAINGRAKVGPALGSTQEDSFQGHFHQISRNNVKGIFGAFNEGGYLLDGGNHNSSYSAGLYNTSVRAASSDGANDNPRTGQETRTSSIGVNYIIKY